MTSESTATALLIRIGRPYRHYKGRIYVVRNLAMLESSRSANEPVVRLVVYSLERGATDVMWARPEFEWFEHVYHLGATVLRFTPVGYWRF